MPARDENLVNEVRTGPSVMTSADLVLWRRQVAVPDPRNAQRCGQDAAFLTQHHRGEAAIHPGRHFTHAILMLVMAAATDRRYILAAPVKSTA
jgi:hypothetical protein